MKWIVDEEETEYIDIEDDGENCEELDGSKCPVDKVKLLKEAIPLLEGLHSLGAQLRILLNLSYSIFCCDSMFCCVSVCMCAI